MKQNPPPAKSKAPLIALVVVALALLVSACVTRISPKTVQSQLEVPGSAKGRVININTASPEELEKLPGIGKAIAERISAHREQYGRFRRAEHLLMVRGISDRKFRVIRSMIVAE